MKVNITENGIVAKVPNIIIGKRAQARCYYFKMTNEDLSIGKDNTGVFFCKTPVKGKRLAYPFSYDKMVKN